MKKKILDNNDHDKTKLTLDVNHIVHSIHNLEHNISINNNYAQSNLMPTISFSGYSTGKNKDKHDLEMWTIQVPVSCDFDYIKLSSAYVFNSINGKYNDSPFKQSAHTFFGHIFLPLVEEVSGYGFISYTAGNENITGAKNSTKVPVNNTVGKSEFSIITGGIGFNSLISADEYISVLFNLGLRGNMVSESNKKIGNSKLSGTEEQTNMSASLSSTVNWKINENVSVMPSFGLLINMINDQDSKTDKANKSKNSKDKNNETKPIQMKFGLGAGYNFNDIISASLRCYITYSEDTLVRGGALTVNISL